MAAVVKRLQAVLAATPRKIIPKGRSGSRELYGEERKAVIAEHLLWLEERQARELDFTDAPIAKFAALRRAKRQTLVTAELKRLAGKPSKQWQCSENQIQTLAKNRVLWKSCTVANPCGKCRRCRGKSAHRGNGYRPRQASTNLLT